MKTLKIYDEISELYRKIQQDVVIFRNIHNARVDTEKMRPYLSKTKVVSCICFVHHLEIQKTECPFTINNKVKKCETCHLQINNYTKFVEIIKTASFFRISKHILKIF